MPIGDEGTRATGPGRSRAAVRRRRLPALLGVLLPCVFLLASTVQASASSGLSVAERNAIATTKSAEREQRAAERRAEREAERAARRALREAAAKKRSEAFEERHPFGAATISCKQVTWSVRGFPNAPGNTVNEQVTIEHDHSTRLHSVFTFDGASAIATTPLDGHAGNYQIGAIARWSINGVRGHFDILGKVHCPAEPAMTIAKLQRIGPATSYTSSPLRGAVGQTVEYEILFRNTGNTPLTLGAIADARCDSATIAGTAPAPLERGASAVFSCTHLLNSTDLAAGSYTNTVDGSATPVGKGSPVSGESNTVAVAVISAAAKLPPEEPPTPPAGPATPPGSGVLGTSTTQAGSTPTGSSGSSSTTSSKSGVLAFKAASVPSLSGPRGCVRASFRVSIRAMGVRSVSFYMDGHRLKTMTARDARHGRLTLQIDPTRLRAGAHRLTARITMAPTASTARATHGTRTRTVLRCRAAVPTPHSTARHVDRDDLSALIAARA
jgi:hypothetical protein